MKNALKVLSDGSECVSYNDAEYPAYAGQSWLHCLKGMAFAYHWHDDLEFGLVKQGRVSYSINGEILSLDAGSGIFINSRQMHASLSIDGSDGEYRCVLIHPSLLSGKYKGVDEILANLTGNDSWVCQTLSPEVKWQFDLMRAVDSLYDAIISKDAASPLDVMARSFNAISALVGHMPAASPHAPAADRRIPALRDMVGLIQTRYAEKITIKDLCEAGNVGASTCYDLFGKRFNATPMEYLTGYRLNKAVEYLENRGLSIAEVAYSTGFSSASYFSECFRKRFSLTPTQYRKKAAAL